MPKKSSILACVATLTDTENPKETAGYAGYKYTSFFHVLRRATKTYMTPKSTYILLVLDVEACRVQHYKHVMQSPVGHHQQSHVLRDHRRLQA